MLPLRLKNVLSGVPQGSILGSLLFVLFINDIHECLSINTSISLYADDTKIWRPIHTELDCHILQKDINSLHDWSIRNKMRFHPDKCKVLSVSLHINPWMDVLPFSRFSYSLGNSLLDYVSSERDLGVLVTTRLSWNEQQTIILSKASQMLGLTKRTCHFVHDTKRKWALYLAIVRSLFEHCSTIWRPTSTPSIEKFELLQKRAVKWILSEEFFSYPSKTVYYEKCKEVNILPFSKSLDLNDLILFHKIIPQNKAVKRTVLQP